MRVRLAVLFLVSSFSLSCAVYGSLDSYLSRLPKHLQLKENGPQKHVFIYDYFYFTPQGDIIRKQRISGEYTRALSDGKARWNNVRMAQATGFNDPFPEGEKQEYMEGFTYRPGSDNPSKPEFFQHFPPSIIDTKNLVWDIFMFEAFDRKRNI
jgi:hypothetical protein